MRHTVKGDLASGSEKEETRTLSESDTINILRPPNRGPWWAHFYTQVSTSMLVDNGPVHFLTYIIWNTTSHSLILNQFLLHVRPIQHSTSGFQSSMGLQPPTPHPFPLTDLFKPLSLPAFSTETCSFPCLPFEQPSNKSPLWQLYIYYHFSVAHPPNIVPHKRLPVIIIGDALENSCVILFICHLYLAVEKSTLKINSIVLSFSFFLFFLRHVKMWFCDSFVRGENIAFLSPSCNGLQCQQCLWSE